MKFKISIIRNCILPLLVIFLIPVSCYYFYDYAQDKEDRLFTEAVIEKINDDKEIPDEEKSSLIALYQKNPPSFFCFSSEYPPEIKEQFKDVCGSLELYALFREISLWAIIFSLFVFLLVGTLLIISYISQPIQYWCFVISWNMAKIFSIVQVLAQGVLLVSFFYYGTILLFDRYFPYLIGIAGFAAAYAAFKMIVALLKNVNFPIPLKGHVLQSNEAPVLYSEIKGVCGKLNTQAPDNIVLGAEDNFFVTEHPVSVNEKVYSGRTLYASLLHLENLSQSESNAIFAHEMAHFSGQDTWYSKKTSPKLIRCEMYLGILNEHLTTLPVLFFLLGFRSLFELSFSKISRDREKRADALAAKMFGGETLANALGKFVLYSKFRNYIEQNLFSKEEAIQRVNLLEKVTAGFSEYLKKGDSGEELLNISVPHPFDSHPPIAKRIKDVGVSLDIEELKKEAITKPANSWFTEIHNAKAIRDRLVEEYENEFIKEHEKDLAYRYLPNDNHERAVVEKYFPSVKVKSKNETAHMVFDYEKITYSEWNGPVYYKSIKDVETTESMMKKYIIFALEKNTPNHKSKAKLCISKMQKSPNEIVDVFNLYYSRHMTAIEYSKKSKDTKN